MIDQIQQIQFSIKSFVNSQQFPFIVIKKCNQIILSVLQLLLDDKILSNKSCLAQSQMITIVNKQFPTVNSSTIRYHSISTISKHSPSQSSIKKQKQIRSQVQQEYFINSISKRFLYFHQNQKKVSQTQNKIAFPYNPLNLCYFESKFGSKIDKSQRKIHNFNSNRSIRNFLDQKLKTQPVNPMKNESLQQLFAGKKQREIKISNQQVIKQNILQNLSKESTRNSGNDSKCGKISKFPIVLKIKSKKAYFLSRFKSKISKQETDTVVMRNTYEQQDENPFETKFRSRTEDNITMINMMREQTRRASEHKERKQIFNTLKQDKLDPWEMNNMFMESSVKFENKF